MGVNHDIICQKFARGETVYMKDEFYEMALRFHKAKDGRVIYLRKFHNNHRFPEENPIDPKVSNTAFEVILGGEFITKEEYDEFDKVPPEY